jgi:chromosome segregation ATPase
LREISVVAAALCAVALSGCQSAYYAAWEQVGYAKRDILTSRVESARDSQQEAKEEITDALTAFGRVVSYDGGDLQARYEELSDALEDGEAAAADVRKRIADVESVGEALFDEWESELSQYSSADLRRKSEQQLKQTRARYDEMLRAMRRAEARLDPALQPMRDQVLYLKHNLNARAVSGLKGEVAKVDARVDQLVAELNRSIAEAERFISGMEASEG